MPTTPTFGFHYASLTDAPNGPAQEQQLATEVEGALSARTSTLVQWGTVAITPTAANTYSTAAVTFPVAFSAVPAVSVTQVAAGTGAVTSIGSDTPTTSGFNPGIARTNTTVTTVMWIAVGLR